MTFPNDRPSGLCRAGRVLALALPLMAAAVPALADGAAQNLAARHLEAGTLAAGATELSAIIANDPGNDDARLGLGVVQFVGAIEELSQGLYRYGLRPPRSFLIPVVRLPVPENPAPESITYADFRGLIEAFVNDVGTAEKALAGVKSPDVKLVLDLAKVRYDANGDGTIGDDERFVSVIQRVTGMNPQDMPSSLTFAFDRGDALWLEGYCNVIMAFGDFLLAHDWHESFDVTFHHFFPQSKSAFAAALAPNVGDMYGEAAPIADFISFVHVRWPVADAARMMSSLAHLKQVTALSRVSWDAIEAETDNDREWLPNPRQTGPFVSVVVNPEMIASWRQVLDEADAILDGRKLVPHWRFRQGFNLRKVFEEPQPFDLVLWLTGPAVLPYLEDGPTTTGEQWNRMIDAFGGTFGVFAIWAN